MSNGGFELKDYSHMPEDSVPIDVEHPFTSRFMVYDVRRHMYFLTRSAVTQWRLLDSEAEFDEIDDFIDSVSRSVYSYIKIKAGRLNYAAMMYRIAKGLGAPNISSFDFRTIFLYDILRVQAKYIASAGYAKDAPKMAMTDSGRIKASDLSETDGYWLHDDVITSLKSLNLTNPQSIVGFHADFKDF